MSLPSFQKCSEKFPEPYKELVNIAGTELESFSNYIVSDQYSNDEQVKMYAFSIVGISPGYSELLECHIVSGGEYEEAKLLSKMYDIAKKLKTTQSLEIFNLSTIASIVHRNLGVNYSHVIGILCICKAIESKKDCTLLWTNSNLNRPLVEHIVKIVLLSRLKDN